MRTTAAPSWLLCICFATCLTAKRLRRHRAANVLRRVTQPGEMAQHSLRSADYEWATSKMACRTMHPQRRATRVDEKVGKELSAAARHSIQGASGPRSASFYRNRPCSASSIATICKFDKAFPAENAEKLLLLPSCRVGPGERYSLAAPIRWPSRRPTRMRLPRCARASKKNTSDDPFRTQTPVSGGPAARNLHSGS